MSTAAVGMHSGFDPLAVAWNKNLNEGCLCSKDVLMQETCTIPLVTASLPGEMVLELEGLQHFWIGCCDKIKALTFLRNPSVSEIFAMNWTITLVSPRTCAGLYIENCGRSERCGEQGIAHNPCWHVRTRLDAGVFTSLTDEMQVVIESANILETDVGDAIDRLSTNTKTLNRNAKVGRQDDSQIVCRIRELEEKAASQRAILLQTQADLEMLLSSCSEHVDLPSDEAAEGRLYELHVLCGFIWHRMHFVSAMHPFAVPLQARSL